jgi:hypothetical protein
MFATKALRHKEKEMKLKKTRNKSKIHLINLVPWCLSG